MVSFEHILFAVDEAGIVLVTINRPEKRNALSRAVVMELGAAFDRVAEDAAIRAAIVTGAGDTAFVAGADIGELAALSAVEMRQYALDGQRVFRRLETAGKPSVAAVNGFALGGGLELALAATVRVASENARLGQPEVKLGLIPGFGGTQRLPRLVGRGRALWMLASGEPIDAAEAWRIGLVNAVVPQAQLVGTARAWLEKVLQNGPLAVRLAMEAVDAGLDGGVEEGLQLEAALFAASAASEDRREGTRAFLEKRTPAFTGK
ncbi:MAG: enoyl-CoA hydratase-related protein [Bryobacteraceae bacterium]